MKFPKRIFATAFYNSRCEKNCQQWSERPWEFVSCRQYVLVDRDAIAELPEVKAMIEALKKVSTANELRQAYHRLPQDRNRIGDKPGPKSIARSAWTKAFTRAALATEQALSNIGQK